jgi:pimeloyl-ACP methyl ester carboxylesterase
MFLAGGPGQAATELAGILSVYFSDVRQEHDIILVDQRGTGQSNPLACDAVEIDPLTFDDSQLDIEKEINDCIQEFSDRHLPSYNTYQAVEDFEAVREALGYKQIHIFGGSYGTRSGLAYLRLHPESIKSAILDSNAPTQLVIGLFGKTSERAFDLLIEDCNNHEACDKAFPNLKQDFLSMVERLKQGPVKETIYHPFSGEQVEMVLTHQKVIESLRSLLYAIQSRQILPYAVNRAANGDYRTLAALIGQSSNSERQPGSLYTGLTFNILCNEDLPRAQEAQFANDRDNYFNGKFGYSMFKDGCEYWPKWEAPVGFAEPVAASVPVLVFSGKYDPVTPPAYGDMTVETLENAKHIVIEQGAHTASIRKCVKPIQEFLKSGTFDELDFSCASEVVPNMFFTNINQLQ